MKPDWHLEAERPEVWVKLVLTLSLQPPQPPPMASLLCPAPLQTTKTKTWWCFKWIVRTKVWRLAVTAGHRGAVETWPRSVSLRSTSACLSITFQLHQLQRPTPPPSLLRPLVSICKCAVMFSSPLLSCTRVITTVCTLTESVWTVAGLAKC